MASKVKIIQFPVSKEARKKLAAKDDRDPLIQSIEANLQRDGFILLAWAVYAPRHLDTYTAFYLPENGEKYVYRWDYDARSMEAPETFMRYRCNNLFKWFTDGSMDGFYVERHICAPLYLLLDNKELRAEYLAGTLEKIS